MKRIDFEHGTVTGNILGAALPMLVAQILSLLYNIVDRVYIARIPDVGTAALGAVGLCFPLIVIITAFSNLFGSGGAPLFSIERGKNNPQKAETIMNTSYSMVCACAVVLMVIGFLFARPLLTLFGASADAMVYAYPYMMLYLIGTLPSMIATGMNPFINAQGYSTVGMLSVTIGAVANLLLDPLFIFVLGFGVQGAAIATVISQTLSAVFVLYFLTRKAELKVRFIRKNEISECAGYAKNIVSLGTAGFIMQLTNSLVTICCNNVLSVTTTGLDPQTRLLIWDIIEKLRVEEKLTVFLTTHYMEEAANAGYVVILDKGSIVAEGTPFELKNEYVQDTMSVYGVTEEEIKTLGREYKKIRDGYQLKVKNTAEATRLIVEHQEIFRDYEVVKGRMDDVFLAVTGKTLGGEHR